MRIAVSGAHGVGKTTLCNDLAKALREGDKSAEVVTNVGRHLHAAGIPVNKGTKEEQYPLFLEKHLVNLLAEYGSEFVIYDRTMVDTIAYGVANGNLDPRWISFLLKAAPQFLNAIDAYFYIPIEFPIEDDGLRATEIDYQLQVDRAVVDILKQCRPNMIRLGGSREERVAQAMRNISAM